MHGSDNGDFHDGCGRVRIVRVLARVVCEPDLVGVGVSAEPSGLPVIRDEAEIFTVLVHLLKKHGPPPLI